MKKQPIPVLICITVIFLSFTLGFFVGRNQNHQTVHLSVLPHQARHDSFPEPGPQADATKPAPAFLGKFDMIISNPPYITGQEMKELPRSVSDFEPHMALYGGEDGLDFYRAIASNAAQYLTQDGCVILELGIGQADAVKAMFAEGWTVTLLNDYEGIARILIADRNGRVLQ